MEQSKQERKSIKVLFNTMEQNYMEFATIKF